MPSGKSSPDPREMPALQLSSYQLVLAISVLLLAMCGFFVAGILVQRYQQGGEVASLEPDRRLPRPLSEVGSTTPESVSSVPSVESRAPAPVVLPEDSTPTAGLVPPSKAVNQREPNVQYVPAPPPRRDENMTKSDTSPPTRVVEKIEAGAAAKAGEPPAAELASAPTAAPAAQDTEMGQAPSVVARSEPVSTQVGFAPRLAAGTFTVQVASFDAATPENARKFKARIEDNSDYDVMIIPSTDGKHLRACIGTYPDRDAALKARDDLAKIREFKDCFIRAADE